ncbi:MAG: hypothetical protein ABI432_08370, partial [Flavobacteriales bacterium]
WDGTVSPVIGQGRTMGSLRYHVEYTGSFKAGLAHYLKHLLASLFGVGIDFRRKYHGNSLYRTHHFPDGSAMYVFQRFGSWPDGDIDGLGNVLAPERMEKLLKVGGFCLAYTHLGKRPSDRMQDPVHIPENTRAALHRVKDLYAKRDLMVSSVSDLLDHAVLRDHIQVDRPGKTIRFQEDGLAFSTVGLAELTGRSFSFFKKQLDPGSLRVCGTVDDLHPRIEDHGDRFTLHFDRA